MCTSATAAAASSASTAEAAAAPAASIVCHCGVLSSDRLVWGGLLSTLSAASFIV